MPSSSLWSARLHCPQDHRTTRMPCLGLACLARLQALRLHAYTNRQVGLILELGKGRTGEGLGSHYHGGLYACWPDLQDGLGWAPVNNAMSLAGGYMAVTSHPPWISPTMLNTRPGEVLGSMLFM
ncbi:uncharacterized protein BO66DRAFT_136265 [Aspergillus aculeatinus CBS 121060]|uniref:Uncharacterized protein n=1 Tax=Aspergillus aculeatinus CBS 121060 TaxID=1448322 RepID=A0ACD1H306_9EURO|nr:hypothetical protein BO66DRAFT_136265 [Aspergillus aculeatinus CBS 121060]RAH67917.1 hypothetical protein BO66DRAFT_136265 [Aspergillus aculeatinus CBS 121060]